MIDPVISVDPRTPVLVGTGTSGGRQSGAGQDAMDLMIEAARAAATDAGALGLLPAIEQIAVPRGTWPYHNPGREIGGALGAEGARTALYELGIPQQALLNAALSRIRQGKLGVALIVGGEANSPGATGPRDTAAGRPDEHHLPDGVIVGAAELAGGLVAPVQQYAMIDNALRHAEGRTVGVHLDEVADLWARFSHVSATNPQAAFGEFRTAAFLRRAAPGNRAIAFPYNKWHCSQWRVDQAGAVLLCSAAAARAYGLAPERCLFPWVALDSSHGVPLTQRAALHRWPAMGVLGRAAEKHVGRPLSEVEHVELYSCFPAAVRVQQRELGLPLDGVPTLTGGMSFAGGPLNNFTFNALAAMAVRLREYPGSVGLMTTVSGFLTKPGLALWSARMPAAPLLVADMAAAAKDATPIVEATVDYEGAARVATYTVSYPGPGAGGDPLRVFTIADTPDGRRAVATSDDPELAARAVAEELIGCAIRVSDRTFQLVKEPT